MSIVKDGRVPTCIQLGKMECKSTEDSVYCKINRS